MLYGPEVLMTVFPTIILITWGPEVLDLIQDILLFKI